MAAGSEDVLARLRKIESRVDKLERLFANEVPPVATKRRKLSAKEFLLTKEVTSETQKVIALAFYLERQEGLSSFNVRDLEDALRSAREKLPKNMNDAVNKNIARGFLMEAAEKKGFEEGLATHGHGREVCGRKHLVEQGLREENMTRNKPLDAMTQIVAILAPLSSEERVRTVRAAMVLLGETNKDSRIEGGLEQQDAGLGDLPLRARTWMKQYGISTADLDQVFQRTADAMAVIGSVPGSNKKEQTYNAYLLTGIGQLLLAGEPFLCRPVGKGLVRVDRLLRHQQPFLVPQRPRQYLRGHKGTGVGAHCSGLETRRRDHQSNANCPLNNDSRGSGRARNSFQNKKQTL